MTRPRFAVLTAACVALPCLALAPRSASQPEPTPSVVVYDMGDLILTPVGPDAQGHVSVQAFIQAPSRMDAVERLAEGLAKLLNVRHAALAPEVHAVEGSSAQQQAFEDALEQLRAMHSTRYLIDVSLLESSATEAPSVGDTAEFGPRTLRQSIRGRTPAELTATRTVSYVARWTPIVSDSAVGYESQIAEVTDGLRASLTIGEPTSTGVAVTLSGEVSLARIVDRKEPLVETAANPFGGGLTIGLPEIRRRSLNAAVSVPMDRATVVCVVEGFEPGTSISVALRLRQAQ
ncbi:MAG: hypothetical protein H6811_05165 [Phycisphaeraceae bacterium]|nr:hypothetical protein [Phycisphaeraceae bacterium]